MARHRGAGGVAVDRTPALGGGARRRRAQGHRVADLSALITVALAAATAVFTIIKFFVANEFRHWPAWVGLILAVLVGVGGWLRYSETPSQAPTPAPTPPPA